MSGSERGNRSEAENTRAIAHILKGKTIERRGRREMEQPKVGPKGELSGSERVNSVAQGGQP